MEQIEVDNKDRPIEDIIIERASVFVDPFQEADDQVGVIKTEILILIFFPEMLF